MLEALLAIALLGAAVACSGGPSAEERAEASDIADAALLTVGDLPGGSWATEDGFPEISDEAIDAMIALMPPECADRVPDGTIPTLDGVVAERFRSFVSLRSNDVATLSLFVVVADSEATAIELSPTEVVTPADDDCTRALLDRPDLEFTSEAQPPTLTLRDARSERRISTYDAGGGAFTSITEWIDFRRGRVFARFTVSGPARVGVDYQALLEEFERRVVAAQN